jgi:hypothetical protein
VFGSTSCAFALRFFSDFLAKAKSMHTWRLRVLFPEEPEVIDVTMVNLGITAILWPGRGNSGVCVRPSVVLVVSVTLACSALHCAASFRNPAGLWYIGKSTRPRRCDSWCSLRTDNLANRGVRRVTALDCHALQNAPRSCSARNTLPPST